MFLLLITALIPMLVSCRIGARKELSKRSYLFTSESVTEGHPDKVADQISDAVLDAIVAEDPMGRVACETMLTTRIAMVAGEITTKCHNERICL